MARLKEYSSRASVPNCKARRYALLVAGTHCPRCGCMADAAALWLAPGCRLLLDGGEWVAEATPLLLHDVTYLNREAAAWLGRCLPTFRRATEQSPIRGRYVNHCEHCGAPIVGLEDPDFRATLCTELFGGAPPPLVLFKVCAKLDAQAGAWSIGDLADAIAETEAASPPDGHGLPSDTGRTGVRGQLR